MAEERERIYKKEKTNDILRIRDLSKVRHFAMTHHGQWKKKPQKTKHIFFLFSVALPRRTKEQSSLQWTESVLEYLLERFVWFKLVKFTPQRKHFDYFVVHSSCFTLIFCSALVCWGLMEQGRPQPLKCWLETLMSPQERPQLLVTG